MTNMPDDYEKQWRQKLSKYIVGDFSPGNDGENVVVIPPSELIALLREADRNGERRGRIDEGVELWKAIVPMITNLPDKYYLAIKDCIYNRRQELQADSVEKEHTDG